MISIWKKCMANDLYTFYNVALYENTTDSITTDVTKPYDRLILNTYSDNIGPMAARAAGASSGGWIGGNHLFTDSLGNSYKTADCNLYEIYTGSTLQNGSFSCYADTVSIKVCNELYDTQYLPAHVVLVEEDVDYKIYGNSVEVQVEHTIKNDIYIGAYYGFQSVGNSDWQHKLIVYNSMIEGETYKVNGIESGIIADYPYVYKTCICDTTYTICEEMCLYSCELFENCDEYLNVNSYSKVFTSSGKTYYNQIRNKNLNASDNYFWKGRYCWYDMNEYTIQAPSDVELTPDGSGNFIMWKDAVSAESYDIYRSDEPYSGFIKIGTSLLTEYIDHEGSDSLKYFYRIIAVSP